MFAPDRRTFLRSAGRLALAVSAGPALADSLPPPGASKPDDGLKPLAGNGVLEVPSGAVRRLGDSKMRIPGNLNALQFSPRGTTLVTATSGELRGLDPRTGKVLFRLAFPSEGTVDSGRLTSRDTFALLVVRPNSGNNYEIRHYAFGTGKLVSRSPGLASQNTQHTAFSVDGTRMAAVLNEVLCLHDAATGAEKWREPLPAELVGDCKFFYDGATLAIALKGEVKLFAVSTGKLSGTLKVGTVDESAKGAGRGDKGRDWVSDLVVSTDGKWLAASVGEDADFVYCWDVGASTVKHRLKPAGKPIGFSPDGSELATTYRGTVAFWTVATGKLARRFDVPRDDIYLSPDGKMLAASTGDSVVLIDAATGNHLPHSADPPGVPAALRFSANGRLQGRLDEWGGWVEWDVQTGTRSMIRPPGVGGLHPIGLSTDGRVALYRREGEYSARDVATGKEVRAAKGSPDVNDNVTTVAMTPDGQTLVTAVEGHLHVVTDKGPRSIRHAGDDPGSVSAIVTDGRTVAVAFQGNQNKAFIDLYDLTANRYLRRLTVDGLPSRMVFSPDGNRLLVGHDVEGEQRHAQRGAATVFDLRSGKSVFQATPDEERRDQILAFAPDGRVFARLGEKGIVSLWDVCAGQVRTTIAMSEAATVNALAFSLDGRTLAASVHGGPVFLWDVYGGPPLVLTDADLECIWYVLQTANAEAAFDAIRCLVRAPAHALPFLRETVAPVTLPDPDGVARHIANRDDKDFRKREAAARSLAEMVERAQGPLREALTRGPSPEARERIDRLLASVDRVTADQLRRLRAIEIAEVIGTPEAARLLAHWATGAAGTLFTTEAASAAKRVAERGAK